MFHTRPRMLALRVIFFLVIGLAGLSLTNASESNASESSEEEKLLQKIDEILSEDTRQTLPASIYLDLGVDSDSGKNYYSSLDLPVYDLRLLLSGGKIVLLDPATDKEESSTSYVPMQLVFLMTPGTSWGWAWNTGPGNSRNLSR